MFAHIFQIQFSKNLEQIIKSKNMATKITSSVSNVSRVFWEYL